MCSALTSIISNETWYDALAMQVMGKNKVLVKVHPEGKYVVDLDKNINMADVSDPLTRAHRSMHITSCSALRAIAC